MRKPTTLAASKVKAFLLCRHLTSAVLVLAAMGPASGQVPPARLSEDASESCAVAQAADATDEELATHHQSPALREALKSESALWRFIIDPSTSYEDRTSAATQGASLLSAEFLPTLWKAAADLELVPTGVNPSPCLFASPNAFYARSPEAWRSRKEKPIPGVVAYRAETRTIFGVRINLPLEAIDYPLDLQERKKSPWYWQVQRAVALLRRGASQVFNTTDRYPEMAEVALRWRPTDFYERQIRLNNLVAGFRVGPAWVETMTKLALQDARGADYSNLELQTVISWLDVHMAQEQWRDLVHVAQIVILQQAKDERVAAGVASLVAKMSRSVDSLPARAQAQPTATSIRAIAKWTADQGLEVSTRYQFAVQVCEAVRDPTCESALRPGGTSSEKATSLARFEAWFAKQRLSLDERVATERPKLMQLAAQIHQRLDLPIAGNPRVPPN